MPGEDGRAAVPRWAQVFPFVDGFEAVVSGEVGVDYLRAVERLMSAVVASLESDVFCEPVNASLVPPFVYSVAALARARVALAYEEELACLECVEKVSLKNALEVEWDAMCEREQLVTFPYSDVIGFSIGGMISDLWTTAALVGFTSWDQLNRDFSPLVSDMRCVVVGEVLVQSNKGRFCSDMSDAERGKTVLPVTMYRHLLDLISKNVDCGASGNLTPADLDACVQESSLVAGLLVTRQQLVQWLWLLLSSTGRTSGYCYQLFFPPSVRYDVSERLGVLPRLDHVKCEFAHYEGWCGYQADWDVSDGVVHVHNAGVIDGSLLNESSDWLVGKPSEEHPDYFARALVDEFIAKHKRNVVSPPVDREFEHLTVVGGSGARGFHLVAGQLYAGVGQVMSPRAEQAVRAVGASGGGNRAVSELDSKRINDLYDRLSDGAYISEDYFDHMRSRLRRFKPRPKLHETAGRAYHVFAGFPADGGGTMGVWIRDDAWDVPGWTSYTLTVPPMTDATLSYTVGPDAEDVRVDCTGEGAIDFGACRFPTYRTVWWFTDSVRFRAESGQAGLVLRLSVPEAGNAQAIGHDMRRYMYVPGFALVVRSFSIVADAHCVGVEMKRRSVDAGTGCQVHAGSALLERGRHCIRFTGLASTAAVRLLVKAESVTSMKYVMLGGMKAKPRDRDYVSLLYELRNSDLAVHMQEGAVVHFSVLQIVREAEFDLNVEALRRSKLKNIL